MKKFILVLLLALNAVFFSPRVVALYLDDTHYRLCAMDNMDLYNYDAVAADRNGSFSSILSYPGWSGYHGVEIQYKSGTYCTIFCPKTYSGNDYSVLQKWYTGLNGVAIPHYTYFYIEVVAPTGVRLNNIPSKMLIGEEASFTTSLLGSFPSFTGSGYFSYSYTSSNPDVITIDTSSKKITANGVGSSSISVTVYIKNSRYSGSYYVGSYSVTVDVVDNMDPTDISLSEETMSLHVGDTATLDAILTPTYARSEITWSSSDSDIVTVEDGNLTAVGRGNATITAQTSNNISAKCYVTVLGEEDYNHVKIGDLYYNLDWKNLKATVVHERKDFSEDWIEDFIHDTESFNYVSGDIEIPSVVSWLDEEYIVESIGDYAFVGCGVTTVAIPNTISTIGDFCFNNSALTNVIIPEGVTTVGNYSFQSCPITSVSLPSTLKTIDKGAFAATLLEYVDIPDSVIDIDDNAFAFNPYLESVFIGSDVTKMGTNIFECCDHLKAIYISEENQNFAIYEGALYDISLKELYCVPGSFGSVKFADTLETIKASAGSNTKIEELFFPSTLKYIEENAFIFCLYLKKVILPDAVLEVRDYAFYSCENLQELTIGKNLKYLGEKCFGGEFRGNKLNKVTINSIIPPTAQENTFWNYDATLVVPVGRVAAYSSANVWKNFTTIVDKDASVFDEKIFEENDSLEVYNLQGVRLNINSHSEFLNLPAGLYIVNGNKIIKD